MAAPNTAIAPSGDATAGALPRAPRKPAATDRRQAGPSPLTLDRVLPSSQEAEIAVLGAMLLSNDAAAQAGEQLEETQFYFAPHRVIFRELAAMRDSLQGVDLLTLTQRLQDRKVLEEVGGPAFLADLVTRVPTAANVEHYIQIVADKALLRQLITTSADVIGRCFDEQDEVHAWLDEVEQQLFQITSERSTSGPVLIRDLIKDAIHSIEDLHDKRGLTGLGTGFRDLDRHTSGFQASNMIVIAARPSMGKTALAMNIAEHVAVDQKVPVAVFSLEMSNAELVTRLLCARARVNLRSLHGGFFGDKDFPALTTAASELMNAPLFIDDTAGLSISQLRSRARRLQSQHDIKLIVIDYLQLIRAPSRRAEASRQAEIADISQGVKALAKELQVPVVVLSQLNRQPEAREGGTPRLADLRESGSIEQDADVVLLLVRPEVYEEDVDRRTEEQGKATLMIAKQRNGPAGVDVALTFRKEYTRFEDAALIGDADIPTAEGEPG